MRTSLALPRAEQRALLTFDKDFGVLLLRRASQRANGGILFRLPLLRPAELTLRIDSALASRSDVPGYFSVVEEDRIRMRPLAA